MALEKILAPSLVDSHFFDDFFDEVNHDICRMHHDLRHGMSRLTPRKPISSSGELLDKHMKSVRECIVTKKDGSQEFRLNVDTNAFKPEEINVTTKGRTLSISASHKEENDDASVSHSFARSLTLPEDVDPESLVCSLSRDGVMTVKGPVAVAAIEEPPKKKQKADQE